MANIGLQRYHVLSQMEHTDSSTTAAKDRMLHMYSHEARFVSVL
jgi:hypothetical protein